MKTEAFDLNLAIQHWRENLAQSPAFRSENLNELESHLRDSVATLQTRGLSDEEAFLIASRRIGNEQQLETEFRKVNRKSTWVDRILWMLIGVQIWKLVSDLISAATGAAYNFGSPFREILGIVLELVLPPLALGLLALAVWRSFSKPETKVRIRMESWLARPFAFAAGLFIFAVVVESLLGFLNAFFYSLAHADSSCFWSISPQFLSEYTLAAALTFVFARKRLRAAAV